MQGLTVGDGFRFGCGFLLAAAIVWVVLAIAGVILTVLFGAGLGAFFQNLDITSYLPLLPGVI
jgi:hypothetical protein